MPQDWTNALIAIATAIIGLATLSVILSKQANTVGVVNASASGLGNLIKAAVSPITGGGYIGLSTSVTPLSF